MADPSREERELFRRLSAPKRPDHRTRNAAVVLALFLCALLTAALLYGARNPLKNLGAAESTFTRKIVYTGALKERDLALTPADRTRLDAALELYAQRVDQVRIWVEKQDAYAPMRPDTELRFRVTILGRDGERIASVTTRATQGELVERLLWRLKEDASRFLDYRKAHENEKVGTFTNTM